MKTPYPLPNDPPGQFGLLMRQVRDLLRERLQQRMAAHDIDLNFSQYITLKKLSMGVASASELARFAELNPGAMTRLLDQLEAKQLVARIADPNDRRALRIVPTEAAEALFPQMLECADEVQAQAFGGLSAHERAEVRRLLEHIRDNLLEQDA